jgi:GT2 family glycosyltransferase
MKKEGMGGVTVCIVYYDGIDDLRRCLACLKAQSLPPDEIFVVDNSPAGLQLEATPPAAPHIIRQGRNLGFAVGNNLAIREAKTEFVATLNADAFPEPNWLESMVAAAKNHPEAAAFGSLQLLDEDPMTADGIGDCYHLSGLAWRSGHKCPLAELNLSPRTILSPCGAAALFRKSDFDSVSGFDEDFFCYCEDIDLGFRLWLAGRECRFVPDAVVRHRGAGSTGDSHSDFAVYHGHRNLTWVYIKNMPGILFWIFLPLHLILNLQMVLAVSLRGQGGVIRKAKMDALRQIASIWGKRLGIQARKKATLLEIWRVLDKSFPPEPWERTIQRNLQLLLRRFMSLK